MAGKEGATGGTGHLPGGKSKSHKHIEHPNNHQCTTQATIAGQGSWWSSAAATPPVDCIRLQPAVAGQQLLQLEEQAVALLLDGTHGAGV